MDELNSSMEEAELSKTLKKLQTLEAEKGDIVLGFIKEKEIIETIHQEQLQQLKVKHEDEIQTFRQEWLKEREMLLQESDSRQVDAENRNEKKTKDIKQELIKKSQGDVKETEEEYRKDKRKLREEYEAVVLEKTSEIEELYRENCILRSKSDPASFEDKNKEFKVIINKLQSKINGLEEDKLAKIMKLKNDFEVEKAELERKQVREKAEFVKKLTFKHDQQNTNNEIEKNKSFLACKQEMEEKIEIVEKLWEERNAEDRQRLNTRLENEIAMQKRRFADELQEKLSERDMTIENLEREIEELSNSVHVERFELAKVYNRELSILNRLDSPTKEDIEVALIDEVAKLRDEQQKVIRNLEKRNRRKMRDFKKSQKPLEEIEEQHKNELEELRNSYERGKEEFEAKLRNEQLNLLKSFEFEKNDIERYFKQLMDGRESEFQNEIQELKSDHEEVKNKLNIFEKENVELKSQVVQEKERNGELFDKLQECESQNARLKEEIERDKRNLREPVKDISAVDSDKEGLKRTVEKLSSLNIQLTDEMEKERKKYENLLEKVQELEKDQDRLVTRSEADELQSSESGFELSSSSIEKPNKNSRDSYTDLSSVQEKKSGDPNKESSKEDLDMQMKLQDSVQEYLLEIKVLQNAMDEKEMEIKQLKVTFAKEKSDLQGKIQDLINSLKGAVNDEDGADEEDLEELKSRYKKLTDSINQVIKDLADKPNNPETSEACNQPSTSEPSSEQRAKGFANEVNALDELINDNFHTEVKEQLGKKLDAIKNNIIRSHELEKLEQQRRHEQEKNRYLKELSDERKKDLDVSGEVWNAVCEKLGLDMEESSEKLKEILQEKDDANGNLTSQNIKSTETQGKSDDDGNSDDKDNKMERSPDLEELEILKEENERMKRTLNELEKHYEKDKEELMEKLQMQHKEFVLSSEAEVIENLIKEKSALEEASIIERFNLGRIYYMEMQDELDEILSQRKEEMDKEHEKEKLNILLKFNKDIADLHKLLADKDENEVRLLREKNGLAKKILEVQRRTPGTEEENDENNNINNINTEAKKLEASLPLKKELADLQRQRQDEHEASVQNLEKAIDLINDLLNDKKKTDAAFHRRYSFASASSQSDEVIRNDSPTDEIAPVLVHESVLSDEDIRTKEDLQRALENLISHCISKENEGAESDTSSGASSDFESEPNSPPPENEEGVSDSGAESIESQCVSIKKADLELAMNLERFSLGRIYYNEYKDSLKSALRKLAKVKDMNQDLEDKLTSGIRDLVNRTIFGKMMVQSVDIETQTFEVEDLVKRPLDNASDNNDKDIPLDTSPEVSEKEDLSDSSEENDDQFKNVKQERMSRDVFNDTAKEDDITQTEELLNGINTAEQATERKRIEDNENVKQDNMLDTAIKEITNEDASTQTDDLQEHMKTTEEETNEKEVEGKQNEELKSEISQKEKNFKKQSADSSSKVLPGKNDEEIDKELTETDSNTKEEEAKVLDSMDKDTEDTEKADIDQEQELHGEEKLIDEDKDATENKEKSEQDQNVNFEDEKPQEPELHEDDTPIDKDAAENKENAEQDQNASLEDEKPQDTTKVKQSDSTDDQNQLSKDQEETSDADFPISGKEELVVDDQQLDESDVETLKRENEKLKDRFDILKALVGRWFVEEIPELRSVNNTKQVEGDSRSDDLGDNELKELREEEKCFADEIKAIEKQIAQLKDLNDANNKKEEEKLNAQELLALKQLEKADRALKKEEEKDLIELLKKEKEEVCKKLEELDMEIKEHEDRISDDEKGLFELMSKKLELEECVALKARELDKNQNKLTQMQDDTEKEKVEEAVQCLAEQKKVLEELQMSSSSTCAQEKSYTLNQQPSEVSDHDTMKDEAEPSNLPLTKAHIPPHVQQLIKAKSNEDKKNKNLTKSIEKALRDKERYKRMAEDRQDRLRPFIKKREKLQKNLREREGITAEGAKDKVSSNVENRDSETPNEKTVPSTKVEDIEKEMMKIRDQLSSLGKKAKIPLAMESKINVLPHKLKELGSEKDIVDQQITEKQSLIENLGSEKTTELFDLLEAKAELDVKRIELQEAFPKGYEELPHEVQEAYKLACLKQEFKNALDVLDQKIKDEENNFKEAVIYQRQGKLDDSHSAIGPMIERKQNLVLELEEISSKLPCGDEAESVNAEVAQSRAEDASERIHAIEDLLRKNEGSIKDEPLRAAAELRKLMERKQNKTDELLKAADALKEKVKTAELKENALQNIPDSILSAITVGKETDEENELSFETVEQENEIKEICIELQSLQSEGEDTKEKEDELMNVIEKQSLKEVQPASVKEQESTVFCPISPLVFPEYKATKYELQNIKEKMETILNCQSAEENMTPELNDLSSLFQKKAEIDKNIKEYKEFEALLNQERKLAETLKTAADKQELEEIKRIIERKEEEIDKLKSKSNEVEEMLKQLNDVKNNNKQNDDQVILDIQEAIEDTEKRLLEAQAEKDRYYSNFNQKQSNVKEAMSSLEDELEETREEMEFVENELEGMRSISEDDSAVSPELLELTKLLHSQKSLKDYMLEINTKFDDCDDSSRPSIGPEEIQALIDEKRDAERKLKEIQEEKSKFEVELQDQDIQETYDSLCKEKARLDQAREDVLHKIHGSNVFAQMAGELKEEEPSEKEKKYYSQALNQMLSDQKTLIKLAEENEKLKEVACRQRELLENLSNSISATLGDDLAHAITSDSNLDEKEHIQLPRAIIDRIDSKDETLAEIMSELENENKKLTTLNVDLSNELDCLRENMGETLSDAILQSNSQLLENKLMAPMDEVISADKTVEEILAEQKDALGRLNDLIGENLINSLLKSRKDVTGIDDDPGPLKATKIMNETDEDLQNVIAAYEFEMDNLGKENDVLKTMLGNDLVHALLDIDQDRKNKLISEYDNISAEKGKQCEEEEGGSEASQSYKMEASEGKESIDVQDDYTDEGTNLETESNKQLRPTDLNPAKTSKDIDELTDKKDNVSEVGSLQCSTKSLDYSESVEMCPEVTTSSQRPFLQPYVEKCAFTAPVLMCKDNKTLGEVIKEYENELDTLKFRLGPDLYKEILSAGVLDTNHDGGDLIAKESEIKSKDSERQTDDSVVYKEARKDSDIIKEDIYPGERRDLDEQTREESILPVDVDNINDKDNVPAEVRTENAIKKGMLDGLNDKEEKALSSKVTENEPKSQRTSLAAPKKMIEEKQSLADIIEGYENDLATLKFRLGPELFEDILDADKHYDVPGGYEGKPEEVQKDVYPTVSRDLQKREDTINAAGELKDERGNLPSLDITNDDLQKGKAAQQPRDLDQAQLTAPGKRQADEFEEAEPIPKDDDSTTGAIVRKKKAPSVVKLVATTRMIEGNQTLAEVVEAYENDLDILQSRLGPELYSKILDAGKMTTEDAIGVSEAKSEDVHQDAYFESSGKVVALRERQDSMNAVSDSKDEPEILAPPETKNTDFQRNKATQQRDELEETGPTPTEDNSTYEADITKEEAPASAVKSNENKEFKGKEPSLDAPAKMIETNQTLSEIVKGYENDLATLKSRLGPELYCKILDAGNMVKKEDALHGTEASPEEENQDTHSEGSCDVFALRKEQDSIHAGSELKEELENLTLAKTRKDDIQRSKAGHRPDELDHAKLAATGKGQAEEFKETGAIPAEDNSTSEADVRKGKDPTTVVQQKEGRKVKAKKLSLVAPTRMVEENNTLAEIVEGYENDLDILQSRLGPELYGKIIDAGKMTNAEDALGKSEASPEEARQVSYSGGSCDVVALQERYPSDKAVFESKDERENLPSFGTRDDDLQRSKEAQEFDDLNRAQCSATSKGLTTEFKETGPISAEDNMTSEADVGKEKGRASVVQQKEGTEVKAKKLSLVAPTRMVEENNTLAEIVEGYESDLDILKSRLGPELYGKILDAGRKTNTQLLFSEKKPNAFEGQIQPGSSGKAVAIPGNTIQESQKTKQSETMPYKGVYDTPDKRSKDDASPSAESSDKAKEPSVSDEKINFEREGMHEEEKSKLYMDANKPTPFTSGSEAQSDQFEISAPKRMIEQDKTLEEVIKGYESELETLKSKLGPQLYNNMVGTSNIGDEEPKQESFDRTEKRNVLSEKQPWTSRLDDSKIKSDSMEEDVGHEENINENDQEKDPEYSMSEGETYLSDGELYESFNIPNIEKEGSKNETIVDDKLKLSAPSIMSKEGKTLGEVLERYENDLEALKSKLGPKLFKHLLEIGQYDGEQGTAEIAKDGYDSKTVNPKKEPGTIELTNPALEKSARYTDTERKYPCDLDHEAKGKYYDEFNEREKDQPTTQAKSPESGESAITSIDNSGSELPLKEFDLIAPKQMLEENKTLEEVVVSYENDLRDLRESLGPQLCDAILRAKKRINKSSDEPTLTLGKEDFKTEMDYLEETTDEKGQKAANWKAEIGKVILESQPQEALEDAEVNDIQIEQLKHEKGRNAGDFDKDFKDDQEPQQNITTQKLEAPEMIAQGKRLDEIMCGYENELGALKSRIGPKLYKDIIKTGKIERIDERGERLNPKKLEASEKVHKLDVILKEKEDENVKGAHKEHKGKEERTSADIAIEEKEETLSEDSDINAIEEKGTKEQLANQEKEKQIVAKEKDIKGLQLKAVEEMLAQNRTLEEVVQDFEKDLATLNSKLGPELFQYVLETETKDGAAKASHMPCCLEDNVNDDGVSGTQLTKKTEKDIENAEASIEQPEREIEEAIQDSNVQQGPIVSGVTLQKGEELSPGKKDLDEYSQAGLSTRNLNDALDLKKNENQASQIKKQLKAPILLAEQGATLQDIIETYEKELDTFNSILGPNLAKAVVEAGGKRSTRKDDEDEQLRINKVDKDFNQDTKKEIGKIESNKINSRMDDANYGEPDAQDECQSNDEKKGEGNEKLQEKDYYLDMFENNATLEDAVKKLRKESKDLKEKLGPNLTQILLGEDQLEKAKEEEERKEKEFGDRKSKDMEMTHPASEEKTGRPFSEKEKKGILDAEETIVDDAAIQEVKCEVQKKERSTEDDVSTSGLYPKTFMAPKLMEAENATLEDVIQNYENDLSVLKNALGPNLVNILLNDKTSSTANNIQKLSDEVEDEETKKNQENKEKKGLERETNRSNKEDSISEEQRQTSEEHNQEKTKKQGRRHETKEFEEESLAKLEFQEPEELQRIISPLLNGDKDESLEDILRSLHNDLDVLTSKLGSNLSKGLLTMDSDSYNVAKDNDLSYDRGKDRKLDLEIIDENETKREKGEYQVGGKVFKEVEAEDKEKDNMLNVETASEELDDLAAIDQMEENSQTLEEVIKRYENNLEIYESILGPYLSKAILTKEFLSIKEGEQSQAKSNVDDQSAEEDSPLDVHDKENEDEMKVSKLDEYLKLLDKGRTLEDVLIRYDPINAVVTSTKGDENRLSIKDESLPCSDEIENVTQNYEHDLSVLKKELGPNLFELLLNDKVKPTDKTSSSSDVDEENKRTKNQPSKEAKQGLDTKTNHFNDEYSVSEEQTRTEEGEQHEKTEKRGDQGEMEASEEECPAQSEFQESEELQRIISPLLNGDNDESLEDILKTLHNQLDVLTSKLGSNLSKCLLTMDSDSYNVSKDLSGDGGEDGKIMRLDLETMDENKTKRRKGEDQVVENDVKEVEVEENEKDNMLGNETAGEEIDDLAAIDQMEENSQTLEEVIKRYENNIERYESSLGPYLSKAILSRDFPPIEAGEQGQAKSNVDDQSAEEGSPLEVHDKENENEIKLSKIDECLKLLDEGRTLEDVLIRYDPGVVASTQAQEKEPTTDESLPYSDQIEIFQKQNQSLRQRLDNLNSKIGKGLVNQLLYKNGVDMVEYDGLDAKSLRQHEVEKDTPKEDVAEVGTENPILEAPVMMARDKRTLEDVVIEYENNLKEMTNTQEELEQCIGSQLFKELCELKRQEGEGEKVEGKIDSENEEKPKEQSSKKPFLNSKYYVVNKMAEEDKSLTAVLGDNENDFEVLEKENASLKKVLEGVSGDGVDLGEIISKYENQITMLENANKEAENNFEDKHFELQNEINDLRSTLEKLAQTLRQDFLDDLMKQDGDNHIEALQIMEKENKTLAEVVEEYEENMKKLEREKAVLQQIAGQGEEGASMLDAVNDHEDAIKGLKEVNKVLNKRIDALTEKIGPQLSKQIMDLRDKTKSSETGGKDDKMKDATETMAAVKEMEEKNITLQEVLKIYEDQNEKAIASLDSSDQKKSAEVDESERKEDKNVDSKEDNELVVINELSQCKPNETSPTQIQDYAEKQNADELLPEPLYDKIGMQLICGIKELDNKTFEELEKEDKRPYALRTMKARNEKLEDVIKAYENTLSNYGLLDTSELKGESLASELHAAIAEDKGVEEVEVKLQEQLALYHELEEKLKQTQEQLDKFKSNDSGQSLDNISTDETSEKDADILAQLKMRNESLKEQLDLSEESTKDALQKYQDAIKSLEIEKAKLEGDKKHEIELLNNKLELERAALERLKNDYDEMLKKEKERQIEDFEKDLERERRRFQKDLEEQSEDYERKHNTHKQELQDMKEKAEKANIELRNSLKEENDKLHKRFEEQMRQKDEDHEKILNLLRDKLEEQMITEKAEMNVQFRQEKTELKTQIEKSIYGDELQKNIDLENDFQESLNKVLKDHRNEIEEIEKEMAQAEERFKDLKLQLLEEFENEKQKETKQHEKEKQEMESTIENLLKEIIKLKHQRKEMRQQYRVEKQNIEEIAEKERIEIQENMERSKNELISKLKQDCEKEIESEKGKYEAVIKELQEALERAEAKKKELEVKLRNEYLKAEESLNNKSVNDGSIEEITREVKVIKKGIEMEYEQKLAIEKQRFEDTLQGLRREVGNLQEKRKIIQERVYNQETHSAERHVIEKSIANYKLEVLSKLEGEMTQRIERERKPLEEEVKELQIENEELKRQRLEMKAQFRREKAALEEEFEREKETLENNLHKEKEELRKRFETQLQKEKQNKSIDSKVSRSTSPVLGEPSPRIENTVRMLKQENVSLVSQNAKHEIDIEQLNEKLKFMEMNFQEMMETEKLKAEKIKRIQEQIPKADVVDLTLPVPEYKSPSTGIQDDAILHTLQEKDQQIHQLLETKKYYESVFGELCDEAGLFELDRNQIV